MVRGFGQGQRQLSVLNRSIIGLGRAGRISATGVGLMGAALIAATAAVAGIAGVVTGSTKAAMDLEDAWTGVLKTTEGLGERFDDLTPLGERLLKNFRDLSTEIPFTSVELAKIAEIGGQVGVAEEDLLDFSRVIADMAVSTDLGIQDASFAMGRFSTVMGTTQKDIRRIGDVIVWLGNTFPATESEITAFLPRVGALGKMFRISEADLLGMVGALASLGINAQAGSTAIQRTFSRIQLAISEGGKEFELLAKVTRMTTDELERNFAERPMEVFKAFIRGIRDLGDKSTLVLRELQLSTARYLPALQGLAETYDDVFIPAVDGSNKAWEENIALADEAGKFYSTTRSQIETTMNVIRKMLEEVGLPTIKWLKEWLLATRPILIEFADKLPSIIEEQVIPAIEDFIQIVKDAGVVVLPIIATIVSGFKAFGAVAGPIFDRIKKAAQPVIDDVFKWIEEHGEEIHQALKIIATGFAALIAVKVVLVFVGALAAVLLTLLNPITLLTTAILAFAGAWILNWNNIREKTITAITTMKAKIVEGVATIKAVLMPHLQPLIDVIKELIPLLPGFAMAFAAGFADVAKIVVPVLGAIIIAGKELVTKFFQWVIENQELVSGALRAIGAAIAAFLIISTVITLVTGLVAAILALLNLTTLVIAAISLLAGIIITNWNEIRANVEEHTNRIIGNIEAFVEALINKVAPAVFETTRIFQNFFIGMGMVASAIGNAIKNIANFVVTGVQNIVNFIFGIPPKIRDGLLSLINEIGTAIENAIDFVITGIQDLVTFVLDLPDRFFEAGAAIFTSIWDGMKSVADDVEDWFGDRMQDIADFLPFSPAKTGPLKDLQEQGGAIISEIKKGMEKRTPALIEAVDGIATQLKDALLAFSEDFEAAGESLARQFDKGMKKGVTFLLETAKEMLTVLRTALAGPLTQALADELDKQINTINEMLADEVVFLEELGFVSGKTYGEAITGGLTVAFPKFQRIIGIYLAHMNAILSFFGISIGAPKIGPAPLPPEKWYEGPGAIGVPGFQEAIDEAKNEWIDEIIGGLKDAADDAGDAGDKIKEGGEAIKEAVEELSKIQFLAEFGEQLVSFADKLAEIFKERTIDPLTEQLGEVLGDMEDILRDTAEAAKFQIKDMAQVVSDVLSSIKSGDIESAYKVIRDEQKKLTRLLENRFGPAWQLNIRLFLQGSRAFSSENLQIIKQYVQLDELMGKITPHLKEQAALQKEIAEHEEKLLRLEEKRAQLAFLREQMEFVEFLMEHKLDPADIIGDLELGLDANIEALLDAMIAALQEVIRQMDAELKIASPSKVFMERGKQMILGLIAGVEQMVPALQATIGSALSPQIMAPAMASPMGSRVSNNTFNTTINSDMDVAVFEQRVLRIVQDDIRL